MKYAKIPGYQKPIPIREDGMETQEIVDIVGVDARHLVEVGANRGTDTARFLDAFPQAQVDAFEPDPRALNHLIGQPGLRAHATRLKLHMYAIGAEEGEVTFYQSQGVPDSHKDREDFAEGWDLSGSIRKPKDHLDVHPWCTFTDTLKVRLETLDRVAFANYWGVVDFMWVDIQGAEGDMIKGGLKTLERTRFLYMEWAQRELYEGQLGLVDLLALVPDFEIEHLFQGDVLLRNRRFPA